MDQTGDLKWEAVEKPASANIRLDDIIKDKKGIKNRHLPLRWV